MIGMMTHGDLLPLRLKGRTRTATLILSVAIIVVVGWGVPLALPENNANPDCARLDVIWGLPRDGLISIFTQIDKQPPSFLCVSRRWSWLVLVFVVAQQKHWTSCNSKRFATHLRIEKRRWWHATNGHHQDDTDTVMVSQNWLDFSSNFGCSEQIHDETGKFLRYSPRPTKNRVE